MCARALAIGGRCDFFNVGIGVTVFVGVGVTVFVGVGVTVFVACKGGGGWEYE